MSCSSFRQQWEPAGSQDHAAACPGCAEWVAGQRRAASAIVHLAARLDRVAAPADREAELRVAFRQARRPSIAAEPRLGLLSAPPVWRWAWAASLALALCAAGVFVLVHERPPESGSESARERPPAAAPSLPPARSSLPQVAASAGGARVRRSNPPRPAASAGREAAASDVAPRPEDRLREVESAVAARVAAAGHEPIQPAPTGAAPTAEPARTEPQKAAPESWARGDERGFRPLPGVEPADMESGQIVRVQLRPDVLDAAGLPPRPGIKGPVEAEVLVGPDGVARGIRLASPRR
jgi:hypothetical protein